MTQTTTGLRAASNYLAHVSLLGVALALAVSPRASIAATQRSAPRIEQIRVGLAGHYKVGLWTPVYVETDSVASEGRLVEVTVADSDNVATTATATLTNLPNVYRSAAMVYTKVGRVGHPLHVSMVVDGRRVDEVVLRPGRKNERGELLPAIPSTGELLVTLGTDAVGFSEALLQSDADDGNLSRRVVRLSHVGDLPIDWFGYDAVDVFLIAASENALLQELAADRIRYAALVRWIELGGRLVVLCGGDAAAELLAEGGPLAALVPGKLAEVVRLPETSPLEHFAKSETPIAAAGARATITVPRLIDVEGKIEVYAGRRPTDLPLVVRAPRGMGEIAFAGVDLAKSPLADWSGRATFLRALVSPYLTDAEFGGASQTLVTSGYNDLSGPLRQALGRSFSGVTPITFPVVAALAIGYLLALGPVDYGLVHRWLRRPIAAWITFPLIVLAFGAGALALDYWRTTGSKPCVNRLELVDVDTITGQARGTFWATLFSARARRFDLALEVESLADRANSQAEILLSWWGLPGVGIGGMEAGGADVGIIRGGYEYARERNALHNVPVLTSSTKSFLARWTAPAGAVIEAQLVDRDGLVEGSIENHTGRPLRNVRLLYNGWAYRLGELKAGARINVGEENSPRRIKTVVSRDALGGMVGADGNEFVAERASVEQILSLMMFYEAGGGFGFAQLPNQFQAYVDLSRLLDLGRAILVADVPAAGSRLVNAESGEPLGDEHDAAAVVYRFVLAIDKNAAE